MPLASIDLIKGKPAEYRRTIGDVIYTAMVEVLKAPKDDRFQVPTERRAYTRGPTRRPILKMLMVPIDISNVKFS